MTWLRHPRLALAVLAVYLAVNVGVGALHHHAEKPYAAAKPAAGEPCLQRQPTAPTEDLCDEDSCPVCHVLHAAQTVAAPVRVDAIVADAGKAVPAVALAHPHLLEKATHSRAPPAAG